ncbi:exosome complex exonuclease RRP44-like protein A [Cucumis melo var. makuwa]|uniref:Exosome complex exonuclease RRP44-like protein A n=1 Tax=Cucumis melo var. makuwa TaxID=1194695 RepID=A0A5A7TYJ1_CUCMM|nr:exosome complex exonuclease RRP44-like protein A [Cucumis melo var. makuwa]TYK04796.1 exosome complex exonuclease RRP44-like protein A [Cucumis melo var. makuwa]
MIVLVSFSGIIVEAAFKRHVHNKSFVKKTKSAKVMKKVREHYLRDDIYRGASICKKCDSSVARLGASTSPILVLDTNVVLTQIDFLENHAIDDVVMLSVMLDEVKNRTCLFTTELELSAEIPCGDSLFSLTSITSMFSVYAFIIAAFQSHP